MMKPVLSGCALLLAMFAANADAQLYKWVDEKGKVNYSDSQPPPTAKGISKTTINGDANTADSGLPYDLAQAVREQPVTLYSTVNCPPCDQGRALLIRRGVPFSEKTVTTAEDIAQLRQAGGGSELPFLMVGRNSMQGMEAGQWNNLLSAAAYPESSKLPKGYRTASPEAAAPVAQSSSARPAGPRAAVPKEAPAADALPPAIGIVPPGFRF